MKYGVPRRCVSQNDGHAIVCVLCDKEERATLAEFAVNALSL